MYATEQDIIDRYSEDQLLIAFDRDGDGMVDLDSDGNSVAEKALADASEEIDGYLAGRYALPLVTAPKILTFMAVDIALYKGSVGMAQTEEKRIRYKDAVAFLTKVAEGKISLGQKANEEAPARDQMSVAAPAPIFTRDTLERY